MSTFSSYIDLATFVSNAAHNVEVGSLIGGNTVLTGGPYAIGATSVTVNSATGFGTPTANSPTEAWIFDGLNGEIVEITNVSGSTLAIPAGLAAAHTSGTNIASAGSMGSLADLIVQASREVDNICCQGPDGALERSLYAIARSEIYESPYFGAEFSVDNALHIHPYHFPVTSVASVTVQVGAMTPIGLSLTNMYLSNGGRQVVLPWAQLATTSSPYYLRTPFSRNAEIAVTLTYTAGPIAGSSLSSVPSDIQRATMLLTSDLLAVRKNPVGAANVHRGDESYEFELRGDFSGHSLLYKNAENRLRIYTRRV